jgi:organic radical activating enzyme
VKNEISLLKLTMVATAALVSNRFVSLTGGVPAAAANSYGVTDSDAAIGAKVAIKTHGTAMVETGGAIAAGGLVETDNQGRAVAKNAGITLARLAPGEVSTAAGQIVEVILINN